MNCPICNSEQTYIIYNGSIRNGAPGHLTSNAVPIYQCRFCGLIWHNPAAPEALYETDAYRESMGEHATLTDFYAHHDAEIIDKLKLTGTSIYRCKVFMDIGCGGGGYADFIRGVAKEVILVEPTVSFAEKLRDKGYEVFSYAEDAADKYINKVDLITNYDVIEHVDDPLGFMRSIYKLLAPGGTAVIGTPTDHPILRELLGDEFNSFVFSVQHPWVFSRKSLEILAEKAGFGEYQVSFHQRFGMGNFIAWLKDRKPLGDISYDFISHQLDSHYRAEMSQEGKADYLILKARKNL
jgi:SAM-dependent methyltransferase